MGGAEQQLLGVALGLPRDRFEVVVGCLTSEGVIARELREAGVRVELLPGEPGPRDPSAFSHLVRFIRREKPEVVHTFLATAGLYGRLAAWLAGVPAIYHSEQNTYFNRPRRQLLLERYLASKTTRVIACCQAVGDFYRRQVQPRPDLIEVIYNAVDFGSLEPSGQDGTVRADLDLGADAIVLGCLGRLTEQKGHDRLLRAMARLRDRYPELRLVVAGQGPLQEALARQASELSIAELVRLPGLRRDRPRLYAAFDVFALPSRWEGLSLALVEAAGSGLPIVATRVGGNAEVIEGESGAWLVPPDEEDKLADALSQAVDLVRTLRAANTAARFPRPGIRERFGLARHLADLERSYQRSLGRPAEPLCLDGAPA
jgi:glycosyltransferase involved in cell wall biosynthesis